MKLSPGHNTHTFKVFLSSANDVLDLRDQISDLIRNVVNPVLSNNGTSVQLTLVRWEDVAPQRANGQKVNELFVKHALESHVTLVLLQDRLGSGTEEEIEAVLQVERFPRPQLSVFWFQPTPDASKIEIERIEQLLERHNEKIVFIRPPALSTPNDIRSWNEVFRLILDVVLSAIRQSENTIGTPNEVR